MIATLDGAEILDEAEILAKMVTRSETATNYHATKNRLQNDNEAQSLIRRFGKLKEKHEEVQRFGRYHPEFETVTLEVRDLKRELDFNETIAAFQRAEEEMESLLNEVSQTIALSVSESIKVPTSNPFFELSSGGGCGSGGSCGCG